MEKTKKYNLGFKYRLYPIPEQEEKFNQFCSLNNMMWNQLLSEQIYSFITSNQFIPNISTKVQGMTTLVTKIKKTFPFYYDGLAQSYLLISESLDKAIKRWKKEPRKLPDKITRNKMNNICSSVEKDEEELLLKWYVKKAKEHYYLNFEIFEKKKDKYIHKDDINKLIVILMKGKALRSFPRFKGKNNIVESFGTWGNLQFKKGNVKVPKIGWVRWKKHRAMRGKPKILKIIKEAGKWYASVTTEFFIEDIKVNKNIVGIAFGTDYIVSCSDGYVIRNMKVLANYEKKLKTARKGMTRKEFKSKNWEKQKIKVRNLDNKIKRIRHYLLHNISAELIEKYDGIIVEDKSLVVRRPRVKPSKDGESYEKNRAEFRSKFNKARLDAGIGTLREMIEYKAELYGKLFKKVKMDEEDNKLCSLCGKYDKKNEVKSDILVCNNCGKKINKNKNLAKNILERGLKEEK